jgi:hypothetical protein
MDAIRLEALLSDGYLLCLPTVEMFLAEIVAEGCTMVAIPRVLVRPGNGPDDWVDVDGQFP